MWLLKNVSFTTRPGEILGLVGKSGGGKSTLMKILRGMESFDSGKILMDGMTITPDSSDEVVRAQMAVTAIHLQRDFALWTETALKNVVRRIHSRKTGYEVLPIPEDADYDEMYKEAMYYLRLVGLEKKAQSPGHHPQRRREAEAAHSQAAGQEAQDPCCWMSRPPWPVRPPSKRCWMPSRT